MKVLSNQNIMDVTLQNYGTLDEMVLLAYENDLNLDGAPPVGFEVKTVRDRGDQRVKQFTIETDHIYNNAVIETTAVLIAATDTPLSPEDNFVFIYR